MQFSYDLLEEPQKERLRNILLYHPAVELSHPIRQTKEELEARDDYFLLRTIKKNQLRAFSLCYEEKAELEKLRKMEERPRQDKHQYYAALEVKRLKENIAIRNLKLAEYVYEGFDACHIMMARGRVEVLENELISDKKRPMFTAFRKMFME